MKVILLSDVKNVGKKGDVVEVSDGYGRNFLIARKLAVQETKKSREILAQQNLDAAKREAQLEEEAKVLKAKLKDVVVEFKVKTGNGGRVFGNVSSKQVVEELKKTHNIVIDKRKFFETKEATALGTTIMKVDLYKNKVIGEVNVHLSEK